MFFNLQNRKQHIFLFSINDQNLGALPIRQKCCASEFCPAPRIENYQLPIKKYNLEFLRCRATTAPQSRFQSPWRCLAQAVVTKPVCRSAHLDLNRLKAELSLEISSSEWPGQWPPALPSTRLSMPH